MSAGAQVREAATRTPYRLAASSHAAETQARDQAARTLRAPAPETAATPATSPAYGPTLAAGPVASRLLAAELARPGMHLPAREQQTIGRHFDIDFSRLRIHTGSSAADTAHAVRARALTCGNHVVFGAGQWQPGTDRGRQLLAHELAHVAQRSRAQDRVVFREALDLSDFEGGNFDDSVLQTYLAKLRKDKAIEDHRDSDDKAREIVKRWRAGGDDYVLEPEVKVLLVKEMQSGFTGDDDERAILNLLEHSAQPDVEQMFGPGLLDPKDLESDFHGAEEDALRRWYDGHLAGGSEAALAGGSSFKGTKRLPVGAIYQRATVRAAIDEQLQRIGLSIRDRASDQRNGLAQAAARRSANLLRADINALPADQQAQAAKDLAADRARADSRAKALDDTIMNASTQVATEVSAREQVMAKAEVLLLDLLLQPAMRDVAQAASDKPAEFQKSTTALTPDQKKAAREAITPMTAAEVRAEASGAAPPPVPVFKPKLPDGSVYLDKLKARIPDLINGTHTSIAANRTKKEHEDKALTRSMDDMQAIANQSKTEVDLVFGRFYDAKTVPAFQADKRNAKRTLVKKGNLRDVWQVEEDRRDADKAYEAASAKFWLFYLIQNDDAIGVINTEHDASPSFADGSVALNDEAKLIREAGDPFIKDKTTRKQLFEIGRGWDAFKQGSDIFIQLFKKTDKVEDRKWLWDMYFTLMHEYLHKLANPTYDNYANALGGEHSTEGNTLIEGVDSLLTEVTWQNAAPRASLPEVRKVVEPDAVKDGLPFDVSLLPKLPHRRYDTYEQAVRLLAVVGPNNLYAAYFQGRVDLIGGP